MSKYELIERLGAGSSAEIFRGRALASSGFEKPIAVKRLLPHLQSDQRYVDWLLAEAKLVSKLHHRNIVQVFDVGLGDDGAYLMVLEYVDGANVANLQRYCEARGERISLDLALHIAAEVAEALEYAHSAPGPDGNPLRVVHRDVSPPNILLSLAGEIKLTDFGFATRPDGHRLAGQRKVSYVSPELVAGDPLDARSDVFSLGVVLFELVTGQGLFSQLSDAAATTALLDGRVPRPRTIDSELPLKLDVLMMRALARNPADRPQTAGQFAAMLRDVRYQLDSTAADPAKELAGLVARLDRAKRQMRQASVDGGRNDFAAPEATIIHVKPMGSRGGSDILAARAALDRFEVEETKMAKAKAPFAASPDDDATRMAPYQTIPSAPELDDESTRMAPYQAKAAAVDLDAESTRMVPEVSTVRAAAEVVARNTVKRADSAAAPAAVKASAPPPPATSSWDNEEATRMAFDVAPSHAPSPASLPVSAPVSDYDMDEQTVIGGDSLLEEISQTEPPQPYRAPAPATTPMPAPASAQRRPSFEDHDERTMAVDPSMLETDPEHTMAVDPSMFETEHTMAVDPSMMETVEPAALANSPNAAPGGDALLQLAPQELAATQRRMTSQTAGQSPFLTPSYAPAAFAQTHQATSAHGQHSPHGQPQLAHAATVAATTADPLARYAPPPPSPHAPVVAPMSVALTPRRNTRFIYWVLGAWGVIILIAIIIAML